MRRLPARLSLTAAVLFVAWTATGLAEESLLAQHVRVERAAIHERWRELDAKVDAGRATLAKAERALQRARALTDWEAASAAETAIQHVRRTLARLARARARDKARLDAVERLAAVSEGRGAADRISYIAYHRGTVARSSGRPLSEPLHPGETVRTGADGRLEISFVSGQKLVLDADSAFEVASEPEPGRTESLLRILRGRFLIAVRCIRAGYPMSLCHRPVNLGGAAVAVRGTVYEALAGSDGTGAVLVHEGTVAVTDGLTGRVVESVKGQAVLIADGGRVIGKRAFALQGDRWWED